MTSSTLKERVQATLKSEDTEGTFELYVTRTPGYLWALLFKKLHIHPIAVTLLWTALLATCGSSPFIFSCACASLANRLRGGNHGEYGFG